MTHQLILSLRLCIALYRLSDMLRSMIELEFYLMQALLALQLQMIARPQLAIYLLPLYLLIQARLLPQAQYYLVVTKATIAMLIDDLETLTL